MLTVISRRAFEEHPSIPPRPRNIGGDGGEAAPVFAVIFKAVA